MINNSNVNDILGLLLGGQFPGDANLIKESLPQWDSLKQIELIMLLEEEFDIRLKDSDLPKLITTNDIVAVINKYLEKR